MRQLCKRTVFGLVLAATVAGGSALPASAAAKTAPAPHKKTQKSVSSANTSSKAAAKKTTPTKKSTGATTGKSTHTAATRTASGKSTRAGKSSSRRSRKVKGQAAPTPDRINEIQEALAAKGAYEGTPSGKWDDSTSDAMRKFQSSHGLNPTGKLDAPTLQKLGFGSETAGMGAPTPPPNSVANRLLSPAAKRDERKEEPTPQE
jgi:peptidoglycan hydrolase-like protein with peptidoglycan-binding domain